jgi:hypothetical protein
MSVNEEFQMQSWVPFLAMDILYWSLVFTPATLQIQIPMGWVAPFTQQEMLQPPMGSQSL